MRKVVPIAKDKIDLKVPEEIVEMFQQAMAYEKCKDECISKVFGWKKAAYFERKRGKAARKAWNAVCAVHPQVKGVSTLIYSPVTESVTAE